MYTDDNSGRQQSVLPTDSTATSLAVGRRLGILLLLQLAAGLTLPFILAKTVTLGSPAFLKAMAMQSFQIRVAVLLSFLGAALTVYLGVTAFPAFWRRSRAAALLFLTVCAISCTLDIVHAGNILSMLALSNRVAAAGGGVNEVYEVVAASVASARRSAHTVQLLGISTWIFVFYVTLFQLRLVPRLLALLGVAGVVLQFCGVTLMMLLGWPVITGMAMPLLPVQIVVGAWLIVRGFKDDASDYKAMDA